MWKKSWLSNLIGILLIGAGLLYIYQGKYSIDSTLEGFFKRSAHEFIFHIIVTPFGLMIFVIASVLALTHLFISNRIKGESFKRFMIRYFDL